MNEDEYRLEQYTDFMLKLYRGAVVPKENPNFNNGRVEIEIYSSLLEDIEDCKIKINGKDYNIKSQNLLNKIKEFVTDNLDILINWSKHQNHYNLDCNAYDGGVARTIKVKYGQLTILVNGQVRDIGQQCDEFIEKAVTLILSESEKTDEDFIMNAIDNAIGESTQDNKEFEKYCKLYEDKFGKKAYIAEPNGTKQKTIDAIKICLEKNEDLLDKLLYPNFDDDINNGVLY
ncbi:MAG TPA: hypothetical protein OIM45_01550 [Clostridiaceae bacterium]|nr:hypothetical protein [Clostridiaceae bacterium]